jgi:hypothetical protein
MITVEASDFHKACRVVLKSATGAYSDYAKAYASAGLSMRDDEEIRVQCLYILNNIGYWRGEEARVTKEILRRLSKRLKDLAQ